MPYLNMTLKHTLAQQGGSHTVARSCHDDRIFFHNKRDYIGFFHWRQIF